MPADQLEHFTVECEDLAKTRHFYCDVLGLTEGFRPQMDFDGHWLYCGGVPVVHLTKHAGEPVRRKDTTGRLDHIAFKSTEHEKIFARFQEEGIPFTKNHVWEVGLLQVFVHDPDGVQIELNFHGALKKENRMPTRE